MSGLAEESEQEEAEREKGILGEKNPLSASTPPAPRPCRFAFTPASCPSLTPSRHLPFVHSAR